MVPMLIIIPLPEQRSGFHVTDSYIFVTLYRVGWMTTNKKHFRRNVPVYYDTLLSIAEGRTMAQDCNHKNLPIKYHHNLYPTIKKKMLFLISQMLFNKLELCRA
jgi:hypothetical protein